MGFCRDSYSLGAFLGAVLLATAVWADAPGPERNILTRHGNGPLMRPGLHGPVPVCPLTPQVGPRHSPGPKLMPKSNKLALPTGKSIPAPGQMVYLTGRVYDQRCLPLRNAKVEIWHANPGGTLLFPHRESFFNPYPLFATSGTMITDNEGYYTFVTLFPGVSLNGRGPIRTPYINFRITHEAVRPFYSRMYFAGDTRNEDDPLFKRLSEEGKLLISAHVQPRTAEDPNAGLDAYFDIVLPGADPFQD